MGELIFGGGLNSEVYGNIKAAAILRFKMGINIYRWRPKYMLGVMSLSARGVKRLFLKYVNTPSQIHTPLPAGQLLNFNFYSYSLSVWSRTLNASYRLRLLKQLYTIVFLRRFMLSVQSLLLWRFSSFSFKHGPAWVVLFCSRFLQHFFGPE